MTAPKTALLLLAASLLLAPGHAWGAAGAPATNPQSSVRLITPWQVAPKSGELILGLHFILAPGWHVYWKNSGDAGFPPALTLQPANRLTTPEILWPTPQRFNLPGDLVAFGYEREAVYPVRVEIKPGAPAAGPPATTDAPDAPPATSDAVDPAGVAAPPGGEVLHLSADFDYLICQVDCVPYRYTLTVDQPLGDQPSADPATVSLLQSWLDRVPRTVPELPGVRTGAVLDASRAGETPDLEIRILGALAQTGKTDLFLESHGLFDAGRPRMRATAGGVVFHVPMKRREANKPLPATTTVDWVVSNLVGKDGKPFNLEARREVQVWTQAAAAPDPLREPATGSASYHLPRLLLGAFLGGLLMCLMPTVLALFFGEIFSLRLPGTGVREGAAAAATGVIGGCWAVAAVALLGRQVGLPAQWPDLLQEPGAGALLVVAAMLLALNLWGFLEIPLPRTDSGRVGTGRHLLAGLFTVPLAIAWPIPLLQEPTGFAFARGPAAVCAVFAVIGFGLAFPYLLILLAPALAGRVPAPGEWLPRLREGLGFLAGGSALWLLYVLSRRVSPEGLAWIELVLLGMGLLAWLRARQGARAVARFVLALALAACAVGALWLADHNRLTPRPVAAVEATTHNPISGG
jgi:DsbC/DsbD-like thiol-disulfide interchange protein